MRRWLAPGLIGRVLTARRFRALAALAAVFLLVLPQMAQATAGAPQGAPEAAPAVAPTDAPMTEPVATPVDAQTAAPVEQHRPGGEANLVLPDMSSVTFLGGITGYTLLALGLVVCAAGLLFGLVIYTQLKNLPGAPRHARDLRADLRDLQDLPGHAGQVHPRARAVHRRRSSSLYFGMLLHIARRSRWRSSSLFSLVGIAGSYGVAWFGIRINTFANSRTAFASLRGKPFPIYAIPLQAGMSIGMLLISVELLIMLVHPAVRPGRLRRRLLHRLRHRRVAGRRGAAHRRRHLHQDRRHRLRPDEDRLQDQGRRRAQPRRDRRLHGRQRRRLGGPDGRRLRDLRRHRRRADHVHPARRARTRLVQVQLLVWIFVMRIMMIVVERRLVLHQRGGRQGALRQRRQDELRGAAHVAGLAHLDRLDRADLRRLVLPSFPTSRRHVRSGGSCRPSSPAARWPARSSPSW